MVKATLGTNTFEAHADDVSELETVFHAWLQAQSTDGADAAELARLTERGRDANAKLAEAVAANTPTP